MRTRLRLCVALFCLCATQAQARVAFNVSNQGSASAQMMAGTAQACAMWSQRLVDPITINFRINAIVLAPGQLGGTTSFYDPYPYTIARSALVDSRFSLDDLSSASHLLSGPMHSMLINRTGNNPAGVVSASAYFDNGQGGPGQAGAENNSIVRMTSANAKAVGLYPANSPGLDATINFSSQTNYDFDPSDGISSGKVDFVGIALHEMGHMLGFLSGVDTLARNATAPGLNDNAMPYVTTSDLFRFSSRSIGPGGGVGVHDWTADNTAKYFSVDGGTTPAGALSNGTLFGDGYEAHHWKNGLGLGIMNPTVASGQLLSISNNDLRLLDAIGYDLQLTPGDFDRNGVVSAADIDRLFAAQTGATPTLASRLFDVNADGQVITMPNAAGSDVDQLVKSILHTTYGDANLDGRVNFDDLLTLAQHYDNATGGWSMGNFEGVAGIGFDDLLLLAQNYDAAGLVEKQWTGFEAQFRSDWVLARSMVPEPGTLMPGVAAIGTLVRRRRGESRSLAKAGE